MSQIVVGTAGHIDHGKTSLVKSLTGIDTDNLAEEKARGLTIDLGFAYLNDEIAIIDVPGHEKFIRNMVAGVSNIHIGLIVVAADDGVMPQTREHLDILNLLGVSLGLVVLTKIDIVKDDEWIDLVEIDIQDLLDLNGFNSISIRRVNNHNGFGIENVRKDILLLANNYFFKSKTDSFRLYVDRVFSKVGFGTIVTGTVQNGSISIGEDLEVFPEKIKTKVRGLQSHGGTVEKISIGQRAAINITNIKKSAIKRGSVLSSLNILKLTKVIICHISLVKITKWKIKSKQRLRFHIGASEILGRVIPCNYPNLGKGMSDNAIIEFESEVAVLMGDKIVIRSYSPMQTIAGAVVIDINPVGSKSKIKLKGGKIPLDMKSRFAYFVKINWKTPKPINYWVKLLHTELETIKKWSKDNNFQQTIDGLVYSDLNFTKTQNKIMLYFKEQYVLNPYKSIISAEMIVPSLKLSNDWFKIVMDKMISINLILEKKGGYSKSNYKFIPDKKDRYKLKKVHDLIIKSGNVPISSSEILLNFKINPNHFDSIPQ